MSTLREMAEEVSRKLDGEADFFLVLKTKARDNNGMQRSLVMTNVMKALEGDTQVTGTGVLILDNTLGDNNGQVAG